MNLIYIADPMCSWCYGFGATVDALLAEPGAAAPLQLALVMGGLRPFTTTPLSPANADKTLDHWRHVAEASGQPFATLSSEQPHAVLHRPGFVYDTEPASRAVVAVRSVWPRLVWRYFKAVQHAFYAQALDVTQPAVLADLAEALGIPRADFARVFASDAMRQATQQDFDQTQDLGVRGFPALVADRGEGRLQLVCTGYLGLGALHQRLADLASTVH